MKKNIQLNYLPKCKKLANTSNLINNNSWMLLNVKSWNIGTYPNKSRTKNYR